MSEHSAQRETASRSAYMNRINRVFDHIDAHLAEVLDLDALAGVANFSPWHFHRVFRALTGETVAERVRRRRLEVAASRLLKQPPATAVAVALDVGFASPEVFTRAFRAHFGMTPSAWRRGGWRDWAAERQLELSKIHQAERKLHQVIADAFREHPVLWPTGQLTDPGEQKMKVELKQLPDTRVAYMRYVGPYGSSGIPQTWQRFAAWCDSQGLMQPRRTMYGIGHDNPRVTAPEKCRYDACVEVDAGFRPSGEVGVQVLAGGRYACAPFVGTAETIHEAWNRVLGEWLPGSGYQCDDRPCFEIYGTDFVVDPDTGAFNCMLCVPVRPL
ncbi:AraC family transcriptional regulator [Eleftheria terrae]|uniref:AraC family transcriptional regulator n=1 Tax=Eleftheria terrae TaxID=1597781 RepID=UPI00263BB352|nr:AraC family transcriptional regulator [Eleftheria terrae]WKB51819.1 AraC family transcriptional regulator [Eleftheria terrae]